MELRHIRYFVAVAEELHFRRAAERLRISQPPLSLQIRELERELGAVLFERSRQKVALTLAGRCFLQHARQILEDVKSATNSVRRAADGEIGELRIAFTQSFEFLPLLPETIHRFRARFPEVTFALRQMASAEQLAAVVNRTIDMGSSSFSIRKVASGYTQELMSIVWQNWRGRTKLKNDESSSSIST